LRQVITDPQCAEPEVLNRAEKWVLQFMRDERDMVFVRTATQITLTVLPVALLLFVLPWWGALSLGVPYLGWVFLKFGGRYGLMLHAIGHRSIFKREHRWVEALIPWGLGPFLGHTPTSFHAHHMFMHHAENNMLGDNSTTLPYVRDNFRHFLHYWARFFLLGYAHFTLYLVLRGRNRVAARFVFGELAWMGTVIFLFSYVSWAATLMVFIIPMVAMRWLMMSGNFAQHSFVDVDDPDNPYKNSTLITNSIYNHRAYNDGYHIVHHIKAGMHWSEMPKYYLDHMEEFKRQDAVVFDGIRDNQHVWFLLMTHNYDKLADCLVDLNDRTKEEKIAFLKSRVRRTMGPMRGFLQFETAKDVIATARQATA
jgi:fatty acid desaturase